MMEEREAKCEVKVSCSLFTRILLAKDARSLNRTINTHLTCIFKMQIDGTLFSIDHSSIAAYFLKPIISYDEQKIRFDIKKSLYDAAIAKHIDKTIHHEKFIQSTAKVAINNYILSGLSGIFDEQGRRLNELATETLQEIQDINDYIKEI